MSITATSRGRERPEFVTLIAIYQFVTAGILLLMSCLIPAALFPFLVFNVDQAEGAFAGLVFGGVALALLLGFGFASIVVGWGLLRMREWARLGAIVLAAFALVGFPIWTIVAILVLVYMTSEEARFAFHPEEAPPEISARTVSTADPDAPARAAYKAERPQWIRPSPSEETRRVEYQPGNRTTNGAPHDTPPPDETRPVNVPIPMPPPEDPSAATESLYDQEADVSDHYRRWKASLAKEAPASDEAQTSEADESSGQSPDESARAGSGETEPVDQETAATDDEPADKPAGPSDSSISLTPDEAEELERLRAQGEPQPDREVQDDSSTDHGEKPAGPDDDESAPEDADRERG